MDKKMKMEELEMEKEENNKENIKGGKKEGEEIYEDYMANLNTLNKGAIVKGRISNINGNEVFVDIGYKSEGIISADDFKEDIGSLKEGNEVEVMIVSLDGYGGYPILSKSKADQQRIWNKIYDSYENGAEVACRLSAKVKGGYEVYLDGVIKAFMPLSQLNQECKMGASIGVRVIEANKKRNNIVVSRKILLEEERKKRFDNIFQTTKEGDVAKAKVVRLKDYGAFMDFMGVEGLLHITDVSWGRIEKIEDALKVGDEVDVKILKIDKENNKVSFGMKQLIPEPWSYAKEKYQSGSEITGKVTKLTDFGIFVKVEEGLEGLVHISDISWVRRIGHPKEIVTAGENIKVKVLNVDPEARRISLGIKQLSEDPWFKAEQLYTVNSIVTGKVREILRNGFTVELEGDLTGFVGLRDLSWTKKINNAGDVVEVGQTIEAKILELDGERRRIVLGLKQVQPNPWSMARDNYPPGTTIDGRVTNLAKFGAFVELADGIEGLIHISDMSWTKKVNHPSEILKKGDPVKIRVLEVNSEEQRISLGLKQVVPDPWNDIETRFPVGDVVEGHVISLSSFGAFVEIEEGIEGLVHVSDMSWNKKVHHPNEMVNEGDLVRVKVIEIDPGNRKIKLGLKQVSDDPLSKYRKGAIFEGEVTKHTEFGIFVKLEEGVEGLIHKSQLLDENVDDISKSYPIGDKMSVMVLEANKDKRQLRLSAKDAVNAQKIEEYKKNLDTNISGGVSLGDKIREALAKNNQNKED
ncbi:MAG: S1 RNA-binding domain-containing protein [Candidatus Wallbacteria bacterium]|nr:S1 RNA-binding domain-containing protein [Candidatus Wallbacteria bacterium]